MMLIKHPLPYGGKKTAAPVRMFPAVKATAAGRDPADPQSYLLHFFIICFHFFTQQSAPYAGLVWSSFRRVGSHFPAVRAVYGDVSGEKEGGFEKNFFHFFPSPPGCFPLPRERHSAGTRSFFITIPCSARPCAVRMRSPAAIRVILPGKPADKFNKIPLSEVFPADTRRPAGTKSTYEAHYEQNTSPRRGSSA